MTDTLQSIPLEAIDADALPRDRAALDETALGELRLSIVATGLRMPIEVWELSEPRGPHLYGLISGARRLAAFRGLAETFHDQTKFAAIPAFIRKPESFEAAITAMVEENAIRADLSPWEQGRIAVIARDHGVFDSIDAAIEALYPSVSRQKRARLRALAHLVDELDARLSAPEALSLRQCLRLAAAVTRGYGDLIRAVLSEPGPSSPEDEWRALLPILDEADSEGPAIPNPKRPGHPRRLLTPRYGLNVRREKTRSGWALHFTGRDASSPFIDTLFDEIERIFIPEPERRARV